MTRGSSCGYRTAIAGSPVDDLRIFSTTFRTVATRSPLDDRACPTGHRRMRKSGEESADHPANFNCELNLPGDRRMSAGWVLNRRITAGFLQDSSQGSPHGDPAIDFALL